MAANFPDSPNTGDEFTHNSFTYTWNGDVWKLNPSSGVKGQKGQSGVDGTKGEKGQKGEKGEVGEKGQKGEKGLDGGAGSTGSTGDKGQKGEVGEKGIAGADGSKGQKGEVGEKGATGGTGNTGSTGDKGQKGQKGEVGATGGSGSAGVKGDKGQKGEVGATGSGGATGTKGSSGEKGDKGAASTVAGDKGQKGEVGATGSGGTAGSTGDKGQKGEEGPQGGGAPVGQIVAWSGSASSLPSGYFLCDGSAISRTTYAALFTVVGTTHGSGNGSSTFNIPDLRDRFIVGASDSTGDTSYPGVSPAATGGSADATLVSHSHTINNHTHSFSTTSNPGDHDHNVDVLAEFASTHGTWQTGGGYRQVHTGGTHRKPITSDAGGHTHSGTTGNQSNSGTNTQGSSATNANLPPYYALAYIIQYAQGGTTAKGQKGEQGATGSSGSGGSKGQKGEVGEKGAASSVQGPTGDKGQKGEVGATGGTGGTGTTGAKGQKGEIGSDGQKGSTGNAGADGDGGGLFPIEAERSSSVSTNEYYAIGNGATTSQGMRIPIASSLQYMTLRASSNVTITVELYVNGSASGKTVSLSSSSSATADFTSSPLSINADDYIAFRSLNNASATTVVAGWFGHDGVKGQTGTAGAKGQKGEIGADGGSGSDGSKGQKGATGATGGTGTAGSKGQKGEVGAQGSGGSTGSDGDKGQKGEIGATGGTGGSGQKGQKGEVGATGAKGQKGQKGEVGEKGQKGELGATGGDGGKGQKGEGGAGAPVGQIVAWSGSASSLPTGYFLCDGSAISRTTYAALYAIIGTTHGAGNGSTTFNLPDLRGKFVVGHHPSNGDYDVADTGGAESVTLTTAQMPSHKHDTSIDGGHVIPANANTTYSYGGAGTYSSTIFSMSNTGGGQAHENRPPYYALAYIIHYAQGGDAAKGQKGESADTPVVKKVRTAENTGTLSGNYSSYTNVLNISSFTPNSTNSVFLITVTIGNFYRSSGSGNAWGLMNINDNGTQIDGIDHEKNTLDNPGSHTFSVIDTRGGTGARNYGIQLRRGNNNGVPSIQNVRIMCIEMDSSI